ncbi:endo-1,4-beta-xylanase [Altererythrobacter sp. ZODW24]|uniref:endo-1,4-beta-xylanase n=1 Tax=Altererythrobacter sp. ZODW24 TaxID=2185142 RepID=UPI000DF7D0F1|nr:endo-1,4-beta-xylanase [Altererythrobacter sp. ZODW24]
MNRRETLKLMGAGAVAVGVASPVSAAFSGPSLASLGRKRGIGFGSALSGNSLDKAAYVRLLASECSLLTAENALKWKYLEPYDGERTYGDARALADYAELRGLRQRGHCFVWNHHDRMPRWLINTAASLRTGDTSKLTRRMWRHGAFLAREFPGIHSWDALNEAVDPWTGELRETELTRLLGNRLVDLSFRILSQKYPDTELVYNDTMNWEASQLHKNGVLRLLERAIKRGVPIDALGIQSHIGKTLGRPRDELAWRKFLEEVQGLGLDVLITEFDCSDQNIIKRDAAIRDAETAAFSKGYLDLTLSFPNVRDVVVWSLSDGESYMNRQSYPEYRWRTDELPLRGHAYDKRLRPKPMRDAIALSLANAPDRA